VKKWPSGSLPQLAGAGSGRLTIGKGGERRREAGHSMLVASGSARTARPTKNSKHSICNEYGQSESKPIRQGLDVSAPSRTPIAGVAESR
jgi:hypothetical protein